MSATTPVCVRHARECIAPMAHRKVACVVAAGNRHTGEGAACMARQMRAQVALGGKERGVHVYIYVAVLEMVWYYEYDAPPNTVCTPGHDPCST